MHKIFSWFFLLSSCIVSNLTPAINLSTELSRILLNTNSKITASTPLTNIGGQISMAPGSQITGNIVTFTSSGGLNRKDKSGINIAGSFSVDASVDTIDETNFGNNAINFADGTIISFYSKIILSRPWEFTGTVTINGNGNVLDSTAGAALLKINPDSTLILNDLIIFDVNANKLLLQAPTSGLRLCSGVLAFDADSTFNNGLFRVEGNSGFIVRDKQIYLANNANFINTTSLFWIDTFGQDVEPVFGRIDSNGQYTSLIDNLIVRQITDQSRIVDPALAALTSGVPTSGSSGGSGSTAVVTIQTNNVLDPKDKIVISNDIEVEGSGTSMTFTNNGEPQVVVQPNTTATFSNIELLRINANTLKMEDGGAIVFRDNSVLEFVEDVTFDRGLIKIAEKAEGRSKVLIRALGGKKILKFASNEFGSHAGIDLGSNELVLEDIELEGVENITKSVRIKRVLRDGKYIEEPQEGRIVLTNQSRVNIHQNTDMNFLIRGELNKFILQDNNIALTGKIRFANNYDNALHFSFNTTEDLEDLVLKLGKDTLVLDSIGGQTGIIFDNDRVTVENLSPYSFLIKGRAYLGGEMISLKGYPIFQQSDQFSLESGLNLGVVDIANPLEFLAKPISSTNKKSNGEKIHFKGESTRLIDVPRARIVIKNTLAASNLSGNVLVRPSGGITSFKPHEFEPLNLILQGNTTIRTETRRMGRVAEVVREESIAGADEDLLDKVKKNDSIYITGTNNKIIITGILQFSGQIIMDENSELIFSFDNSTDNDKIIKFGDLNNIASIDLPPTASLIFEGGGSVIFQNGSNINFKGDSPEDLEEVAPGVFSDNRPNLIFRDYAQLDIDDNTGLNFKGKGKIIAQNYGAYRVVNGLLNIGADEEDFFDLIIDRNGAVRIGIIADVDYTIANRPAKFSLSQGLFNLRFDRSGELSIRNGGLFEIGTYKGVFQNGKISSAKFDRDSKISITNQGLWLFGQSDITNAADQENRLSWQNTASLLEGDGIVGLVTQASTTPILLGQLQARTFENSDLSPFRTMKNLIQVTPELINATHYIDKTDNLYKVITGANQIVTLDVGDVIRREGPTSGTVFGTSAAGRRFGILLNGTKEFYS